MAFPVRGLDERDRIIVTIYFENLSSQPEENLNFMDVDDKGREARLGKCLLLSDWRWSGGSCG